MIQITFQNQQEDINALADYWAGQTEQGKRYGRETLWNLEYQCLAISALWGLAVSWFTSKLGIRFLVLYALLLLCNLILLLRSRFRPKYFLARQGFLGVQKDGLRSAVLLH